MAEAGQEGEQDTAQASREAPDKTPRPVSAQGLSLQMMETFCLAAASILAIITFSLSNYSVGLSSPTQTNS